MSVRFFRRVLLFLLLAAVVSVSASSAWAISEEDKASRAFKFAKGLFDMEKYGEAASELQKFLSFYEKNKYCEYALYLLGESLYKSGEYARALDKYSQFLTKYKESKLLDDVYYSAGYAAESLDSNELALSYFQKIYESPKNELRRDAVFKCARLLLAKKDHAGARKAVEDYFAAAAVLPEKIEEDEKPRYKEALYMAGNIHLRAKEIAKAREYYEAILKYFGEDPLAVPANYNIGEMQYSKSDQRSAAAYYKKALSILDGLKGDDDERVKAFQIYYPKIYYSLGWCYYSAGDHRQAAENFSLYAEKYKKSDNRPDALLRLGVCYFNLKRFKDAENAFNELKKIGNLSQKTSREADYYLAMTLQKSGLASNALEHFEKLSAGTSEIASESAYMAAVILFDQKKYDDAISRFNNFVKNFSGSPRAQFASFNVGLAFFNVARYKEAEDAFYAFLKGYPRSDFASRAWFNLGEIAVLKKNYDGAHSWFMKIGESDPLWLEAQLKICDIYQISNDIDKLSQKYEEVLKKADGIKADSESLIPVLFKMGKALSARQKFELAAAAYEKIIAVSKSERNSADARFKLAAVYFARGEFEKSMKVLAELDASKTVGGNYNSFEAGELLGRNLAGLKKYEEAVAVFEKIISDASAPEHIRALAKFSKGTALLAAQKFDKAVELFEALVSEAQDVEVLAKAHIALARGYSALEKNDDAVRNLLKIEILYRDSESLDDARLMLLELYVKMKKNKDARTLREDILKSGASKTVKDRAREILKK